MECGSHNLRSGVALREARWPAAALVRARRAMAIPAMDSNKDADISTKDWYDIVTVAIKLVGWLPTCLTLVAACACVRAGVHSR